MYREEMNGYWENNTTIILLPMDMDSIVLDTLRIPDNKAVQLTDGKREDKVYLRTIVANGQVITVYGNSNGLYVVKSNQPTLSDTAVTLPLISIPYMKDGWETVQTMDGCVTVSHGGKDYATIDPYLIETGDSHPVDLSHLTPLGKETIVTIALPKKQVIISYDPEKRAFIGQRVSLEWLKTSDVVTITLLDVDTLRGSVNGVEKDVSFREMNLNNPIALTDKKGFGGKEIPNIFAIFRIDGKKYYVYTTAKGVYLGVNNHYHVTGYLPVMKTWVHKEHLYFGGFHHHRGHKASGIYNTLHIGEKDSVKIPFTPFISSLKQWGYFKVPLHLLRTEDTVHQRLYIGDEDIPVHNLKRWYRDRKEYTIQTIRKGDVLHLVRTDGNTNLVSTVIPFTEEYSTKAKWKRRMAKCIATFLPKKNHLFFEKKSAKADESAFRVFEHVREKDPIGSHYFVLDARHPSYESIRAKHGKHLIAKYSFQHYLKLFTTKRFFSSELSNHLFSDRLYINGLKRFVRKIPLVFLQHGIMFAKPVDNPMAGGFYKNNKQCRIEKCIISSPLEGKEFEKMGYTESDLLLSGLPTLDKASLEEGADKIAFMPTYRYWEESLVYQNRIEETSYYRTIMRMIETFEKEGLLHRLLIVPHNKFSAHIYENMPQYRSIISDNPSQALRMANIFITDYSSAIYDAIFRGAYPIFYWEEKDYLIEQYKGIPPVNEKNAPGIIANSMEELARAVKVAIENNYDIPKDIQEKYKRINQFDDRKNTERLVQILRKQKLL